MQSFVAAANYVRETPESLFYGVILRGVGYESGEYLGAPSKYSFLDKTHYSADSNP